MKNNKIKIVLFGVLASVMLFYSCTEDFSTLNTDPNNPTDVPAVNILVHAIQVGVDRELGAGWLTHTYLGPWSQIMAKIQYIDEGRYIFRPTSINAFWNGAYQSELKDLQIVEEKAKEKGFASLEAAARIMKAYFFHRHTDIFGDIPYSEALVGDTEGKLTPAYDSQQSIYNDLISELKACDDILAEAVSGVLPNGDVIFSGDVDSWRKFANSLLLRIYMRMSGADPATAQAGIEEVYASGNYIQSNADNVTLGVNGSKPYRNGLMETLETRTDQGSSKTMIDLLKERNDPRIHIYAQDIDDDYGKSQYDGPDDEYAGQINGDCGSGPDQSTISLLGVPIAYDPNRSYQLLSYAEVCFIFAEAANNGWSVGDDARTWYEAGITASMEQWSELAQASPMSGYAPDEATITQDEIDTYLDEDEVAWDAAKAEELILTQRWIALMPNGSQAYALVRRTGYPAVIETYELPCTAYPGLGVPLRFPYPTDEESLNSANLQSAKAGIHDSMYGKPVWWDTRTTTADGSPRPGID
ncbi:MAG: SusD/RagB family nutrient-binding outer membrane lipoprotein [bacterium]